MTKSRRCALCLLALCAVLALAVLAAGLPRASRQAEAENAQLSEEIVLEDMYLVGTELTLPSSGLVWQGQTYAAERLLHFPGGYSVSSDTVVLEERGKYTLEYRAQTTEGLMLSHTLGFVASEPLYSLSGGLSSASYGTAANAEGRPGIVASIASGESLVFNQRIDLSGNTASDTIAELFVAPQQQGLADALNIVFVLTDAQDSSNTVTVTAKRLDRTPLEAAWQERNTYVTANAADQMPTGLESSGSGSFVWEGGTYNLHQNNIYGAGVRFSISGVPNISNDCSDIGSPEDIATQSLTLSMDYAERRVYMNGAIVADLDDVTIFPLEQWGGFTDGECYLSIYATSYNQERFNCVVTNAFGVEGEELKNDVIVDDTKPQIEMVYGDYADTGYPDAVAGIAYPIPEARAYDETDREVDVNVRVYRDYGARSEVNVTVKNGCFVPASAGVYTVVYSASDLAGNPETLEYEVRAVSSADALSISLGEHATEGTTGVRMQVAEGTVQNAKGIAAVSVRAVHGDVSVNIPTEGENAYSFMPLYAGAWDIVYEYSDYMEQKTQSYQVEIEPSAKPYIEAEVVFPKYIIRGAAYELPELFGYVFETGSPVEELAAAYISDDGGAERAVTGSRFTSYADTAVTITYRLGTGDNTAEKSYTVPVVDVGYDGLYLDISDYFVGDAFEKQSLNASIAFTTDQTGTQYFEFINPVQVFDFRMAFRVMASANNFDTVNVYLTDSVDPSVTLKASYIRNVAGNTNFTVNDGDQVYSSSGDFVGSSGDNFYLYYDNDTLRISPSADFNVAVSEDMNGKAFTGFPSNKVYIRIELAGIAGNAGVEMVSINNQTLTRVSYDLIRPEISMDPVQGEQYFGERITISATYAGDVLDPNITFRMQVTKPDGSYAVSEDGVTLDGSADPGRDYVIVTDQYGRYSIVYECDDTAGNSTTYSYVFNVVDTVPPEIVLGDAATSAKVGDTVIVAQASVTDNYTECTLQIKLKLPDGKFVDLPGNSFVATAAGEYTVYYFAYDADFNPACVSYAISVS